MKHEAFRRAAYVAFLKAIRAVGVKEFKKTTLFGSNEKAEAEDQDIRDAA